MKNRKKMKEKTWLVLSVAVCVLFIAVAFSSAAGNPVFERNYENEKGEPDEPTTRPFRPLPLPPWFYNIVNPDWNFWDNPPDMYAIPAGNVGIGTTNPVAKLDVEGQWVQFKNPDGPVSLHLHAKTGDVSSLDFYECHAGPQGTVMYHPGYSSLMLTTSGDPVKHILIMPRNNVGIGTTDPTTRLHVNGPVATAITFTGTPPAPHTYEITSSDSIIFGNNVAQQIWVELPLANTCPGRELTIKKISSDGDGAVSPICSGSDMLDNCFNTHALNTRNDYIVVVSDGISNWYVVGMGPGFC